MSVNIINKSHIINKKRMTPENEEKYIERIVVVAAFISLFSPFTQLITDVDGQSIVMLIFNIGVMLLFFLWSRIRRLRDYIVLLILQVVFNIIIIVVLCQLE